MDIDKLKALLATPPYDTMPDEAAAAALNAHTVSVQGDVSKATFVLWLAANDGFATIQKARASEFLHLDAATQAGVRAAGEAANTILSASDIPSINTANPQVMQLFGLFVMVGLLSQASVDSFMAFGATMKSPAVIAGLGYVEVGHIQHARGKN